MDRRKFQKGMSIIELVTASSILLTLSMGMATFIPAGFKINNKNRKAMVSNQLFSEVMETVNTLDFDTLNLNGDLSHEQSIPSGQKTLVLLDTRTKQVSLNTSGATPQVTGDTVTIGSGSQAHVYPAYYQINHVQYRVDLKVVKGRYNDLMAYHPLPPGNLLNTLGNYLAPTAEAAASGSARIQVNPSNRSGYKNTTTFEFSANCNHCPPEGQRQYNWNFGIGEGPGSSEATPNKVFTQAGLNKKVFLSITDTQNPDVVITDEVYLDIRDSAVSFTMDPSEPVAGESVTFSATCDNTSSSDCGNNPSFNWNFGDGQTATGGSVTHIYTEAGTYTPAVNVSGGADPTASQPITVLNKNGQQAFLQVQPQSTGTAGPLTAPETTDFVLQTRSQGYGTLGAASINYKVDFGDGSNPVILTDNNPSDDLFPSVHHKYVQGGQYTVKLFVSANNPANPDQATISQTSTNITAVSSVKLDADHTTALVGQPISFQSSAIGAGITPAYDWDFGDGTTQTGDYSGLSTHSYTAPGTYTVTVRVTGGTDPSISKQITVTNTLTGTSHKQAEMKKVYVTVTRWQNSPTTQLKPLASGTFLKGDNRQ